MVGPIDLETLRQTLVAASGGLTIVVLHQYFSRRKTLVIGLIVLLIAVIIEGRL